MRPAKITIRYYSKSADYDVVHTVLSKPTQIKPNLTEKEHLYEIKNSPTLRNMARRRTCVNVLYMMQKTKDLARN